MTDAIADPRETRLLDAHPVETLIVSLAGTLLYANRPGLATLDLGAHLVGQQVFDAFAEPLAQVRDRIRTCAGSNVWQPLILTVGPSLDTGIRVPLRARGLRDPQTHEITVMIVSDGVRHRMFDEHRRLIRKINRQLAEAHERQRELDRSLSNEQKLHQELIHRVKNNLALLSGLIRARRQGVTGQEARDALQDIFTRVMAVGLVHTMLDRDNRIDELDLASLLETLCDQLEASLCPPGVRIRCELASSIVTVAQATPVALLVNEMLTNALKHAFVGRAHGTVSIQESETAEGEIRIEVIDDGIGSDAASAGQGTRIMEALTDQLGGRLERVACDGTGWRLTFRPRGLDGRYRTDPGTAPTG